MKPGEIILREIGRRAMAFSRNQDIQMAKDHLDLLRTENAEDNNHGTPFADVEAGRLGFLRYLHKIGRLSEWPGR